MCLGRSHNDHSRVDPSAEKVPNPAYDPRRYDCGPAMIRRKDLPRYIGYALSQPGWKALLTRNGYDPDQFDGYLGPLSAMEPPSGGGAHHSQDRGGLDTFPRTRKDSHQAWPSHHGGSSRRGEPSHGGGGGGGAHHTQDRGGLDTFPRTRKDSHQAWPSHQAPPSHPGGSSRRGEPSHGGGSRQQASGSRSAHQAPSASGKSKSGLVYDLPTQPKPTHTRRSSRHQGGGGVYGRGQVYGGNHADTVLLFGSRDL